ncbi:MAG: vWA domain-containing protein, partial [Deltaproteobacteria bacterium]
AAGAVLRRAGRLVGPLRASTKTVREPLLEPWGGELDEEASIANLLGKPHAEAGDLIVRRRVDRRHQVVLMVDTSLSMAGEKMALAAVAAAVLTLKLRPGDLAVVLFADVARVVARFGEELAPAELVRRMLSVPCGGGTDIAAALEAGHSELRRGRDPGRCGLLVSDGVCTSGADPLPAAARFGPLHVLLMEDHVAARDRAAPVTAWIAPRLRVGEAVARAADGGLVRVDGFPALPRRMLEVADRVLR